MEINLAQVLTSRSIPNAEKLLAASESVLIMYDPNLSTLQKYKVIVSTFNLPPRFRLI